jgi:hypothetical protein
MSNQIEKYITNIEKRRVFSRDRCEDIDEWYFQGDGQGDFEKTSYSATKEVVEAYIIECNRQIEIAKEYLNV